MRLHGSIFIPSQLFLVRFTSFTRTVIIFLGAIWADFYLESRIQAASFTDAPLAQKCRKKEKIKRKSKTNPKAVIKKDCGEKKSHFVLVFVSTWKFLTKIFWISAETL